MLRPIASGQRRRLAMGLMTGSSVTSAKSGTYSRTARTKITTTVMLPGSARITPEGGEPSICLAAAATTQGAVPTTGGGAPSVPLHVDTAVEEDLARADVQSFGVVTPLDRNTVPDVIHVLDSSSKAVEEAETEMVIFDPPPCTATGSNSSGSPDDSSEFKPGDLSFSNHVYHSSASSSSHFSASLSSRSSASLSLRFSFSLSS